MSRAPDAGKDNRFPAGMNLTKPKASISAKEARAQACTEDKRANACFDDWRRFCFVLREIANGTNGLPMSGEEAQRRARAILTECGYTWDWRAKVDEQRDAVVAILKSSGPSGSMRSDNPGGKPRLRPVGSTKT
jgi:hypothetical protein